LRSVTERIAILDREVKGWDLHAGDLLLVDEAGMVGTFALDRLAAQASEARAKLLLVGDWAQLAGLDASGAFCMLVDDRPFVPELIEVRRLHSKWERRASGELRVGSSAGVDAYLAHDRVVNGNRRNARHSSPSVENRHRSGPEIADDRPRHPDCHRAQPARPPSPRLHRPGGPRRHPLADGLDAGVGDIVVTRHNDRRLRLLDGEWPRNQDRWTVTGTCQDGSMTVRHADNHGLVVLLGDYVAHYVQLG
jgi:hypothetical protein